MQQLSVSEPHSTRGRHTAGWRWLRQGQGAVERWRASLDVARQDGHVQVGRRRVVELGVLEIAELHGELEVDPLLLDVVLREGEGEG